MNNILARPNTLTRKGFRYRGRAYSLSFWPKALRVEFWPEDKDIKNHGLSLRRMAMYFKHLFFSDWNLIQERDISCRVINEEGDIRWEVSDGENTLFCITDRNHIPKDNFVFATLLKAYTLKK